MAASDVASTVSELATSIAIVAVQYELAEAQPVGSLRLGGNSSVARICRSRCHGTRTPWGREQSQQ